MNISRGYLILETSHKLKQLNLSSTLNLMPRSEFITLCVISKLLKDDKRKLVYISDIAQNLEITAPAVSRTLKHMEEKELIKRISDKDDRRNVYIIITETGKSAMKKDMEKISEFFEKAISHLTDDEIMQFSTLYNKIYEGIKLEIIKSKENNSLC